MPTKCPHSSHPRTCRTRHQPGFSRPPSMAVRRAEGRCGSKGISHRRRCRTEKPTVSHLTPLRGKRAKVRSHMTPLRGKRMKVRSRMTPLRGKAREGEESPDTPALEGEESPDALKGASYQPSRFRWTITPVVYAPTRGFQLGRIA